MSPPFTVRVERDALILSFSSPARTLSWAILNGGFCHADHIINQQINGNNASFAARPGQWLEKAAYELGLQGKVVAMATAVEMRHLARVSLSAGHAEVTCFATVGWGNALSVGDSASFAMEERASPPHTINTILVVQPGLWNEAIVEAIQIATEGRVRALYEAGIRSSLSDLPATGTGTDCIAVASLGAPEHLYCGKHTLFGELIGRAAYTAVRKGLALSIDG